jgi:hypothetical protein
VPATARDDEPGVALGGSGKAAEKRPISARGLSKPPTRATDLFQEETDDPLVADRRNFFKVELCRSPKRREFACSGILFRKCHSAWPPEE